MLLELIQKTWVYSFLLKSVLPHLNFRLWGYPNYPMQNYFELRDVMQENPTMAYVFVGVDKCSLSYKLHKLLTKAKWNHTGFAYVNDEGEINIAHMLGKGFCIDSLLNYMREVDDLEILCLYLPWDQVSARIMMLVEKCDGFDFNFDLKDKNYLFCSELVLDVVKDDLKIFTAHKVKNLLSNRPVFEPDDAWLCARKVQTAGYRAQQSCK